MKPYAWLSIVAALTTIVLKTVAWWMTGSVGLLSAVLESLVNLAGPRWRCRVRLCSRIWSRSTIRRCWRKLRLTAAKGPAARGCALLSLALMLLLPLPALAWNAAGHRLVACIAWNYLDEHSRSVVSRLLRTHPDYARWRDAAGAEQSERSVFIEASTWPDDIRRDSRFYSAGSDEATPTLAGFPDMERHGEWHYVNRPLADLPAAQARGLAVAGRLDKQLAALSRTLGSSAASPAERAYALPWLIHLVGDAHQPLHATSRLDAQNKADGLGNELTVINPFNPRKRASTLHAYWDDLPGPAWLRGARLDAASRALAAYLEPPPAPAAFTQWLDESWQVARDRAYPPGDETVATISVTFYENSRTIANQRVALAGYRLAVLLNELFRTPATRD